MEQKKKRALIRNPVLDVAVGSRLEQGIDISRDQHTSNFINQSSCNRLALLGASTVLAVGADVCDASVVLDHAVLADVVSVVVGVLVGGQPRVSHLGFLVLDALLDVVGAALGESARSRGQVRSHGGARSHPVGQGVLAVLDDRLAGIVSVVRLACLAGGDWGVVDKLQQVLSVAGDDGNLLAVLAQSVKLVGKGGLDFLAGDVGQLGFGHQRLGLGTNQFLLEHDDAGRVGVLVLELGDFVGDFLLAYK